MFTFSFSFLILLKDSRFAFLHRLCAKVRQRVTFSEGHPPLPKDFALQSKTGKKFRPTDTVADLLKGLFGCFCKCMQQQLTYFLFLN